MNWSKIVREYFTYNKRERRGLSTLIFIIVCLIGVRLTIAYWPKDSYQFSDQQKEQLIELAAAIGTVDSSSTYSSTNTQKSSFDFSAPSISYSPDSLNPNEANVDLLVKTGLGKGSAVMLNKYVSAGGKIYNTEDLLKVYYMDTSWVEAMTDYFVFPKKPFDSGNKDDFSKGRFSKDFPASKVVEQSQGRVDLNTADSIQLERIPGLGPFYVKEIIKLREKLGGIRDYSQLLMVYKMRDETIDGVAENTFIDSASFQFIYINQVSLDRLGRHPYISWRQAKTLINYRFQHGEFESLPDIKKCEVISDSTYQNLLPYLKLK